MRSVVSNISSAITNGSELGWLISPAQDFIMVFQGDRFPEKMSGHIVRQFVTWEQFQALESAFADIDGVRLIYCEGVLEIVGIGRTHEMTRTLLCALLGQYFTLKRIRFVSTGAYTQSLQGRAKFQADLSYNFDTEKEISDLCIEVVVTSGNVAKLRKYQFCVLRWW